MDGSAAAFLAENVAVTNAGLFMFNIILAIGLFWHSHHCDKRRKALHEMDNEIVADVRELKTDMKWIRERLERSA